MRRLALALSFGLSMAGGAPAFAETAPVAVETPIVIGQSYALPSTVMGQTREINVWLPPGYAKGSQTYPVLYVLDGGQDQYRHIQGGVTRLPQLLVQVPFAPLLHATPAHPRRQQCEKHRQQRQYAPQFRRWQERRA